MKIGVFDSGLGGLTILKKLIDQYPNNEYIYYGDTKNAPYGDKTIEELKQLSSNIVDFLIEKEVKIFIIACGTLSSNLSLYLKEKYDKIFIDIITPTISYLNESKYKNIGVIATQATINSKIFSKNVNKNIKEIACPKFAPLIEQNNIEKIKDYFEQYLKKLKDRDIIVLGCTHYPIIKKEIKQYLGDNIELLDMSDCINNIPNNGESKVDLYFSKLNNNIIDNINNILLKKVDSINLVNT